MKKQIAYLIATTSMAASFSAFAQTPKSLIHQYSTCPHSTASGDSLEFLPILPALFAAIAPSVISTGVDFVGKAIEANAQPETKTQSASTADYLLQIKEDGNVGSNPDWGCFVFVIADPEQLPYKPASKSRNFWNTSTADEIASNPDVAKLFESLKANDDLRSESLPYFYMEAIPELSSDKRFFRLAAKTLYFKRPLVSGNASRTRDLVVTFTITAAGGSTALASAKFTFSDLRANTFVGTANMRAVSDWMPMLAPDATEVDAAAKRKTASMTSWKVELASKEKLAADLMKVWTTDYVEPPPNFLKVIDNFCKSVDAQKKKNEQCPVDTYKLQLKTAFYSNQLDAYGKWKIVDKAAQEFKSSLPKAATGATLAGAVNISAAVSETREASKLLGFLSTAFKGAQGDITTTLQNELIPSKRAAAEKAAQSAAITAANDQDDLYVAALQAKQTVLDKEDALAALGTAAPAAQLQKATNELRIAKIGANKAYRSARLPAPYPEVLTF